VEAEETTPLASDSDVAGPHGIPQGESDTDSLVVACGDGDGDGGCGAGSQSQSLSRDVSAFRVMMMASRSRPALESGVHEGACELSLQPQAAAICRKRAHKSSGAVVSSPPTQKKSRSHDTHRTDAACDRKGAKARPRPRKTLQQRVDEHKGEFLAVIDGVLYCQACGKQVAGSKDPATISADDISKHVKGLYHKEKKKQRTLQAPTEKMVVQGLRDCWNNQGGKNRTLSDKTIMKRYRVAERFMMAGLPFYNMDILRPELEDLGAPLSHSSHMREYIPMVLARHICC